MRIGLLAKGTGVSRDTIRLYYRLGLLNDVTQAQVYNNYFDFPESNVDRIVKIKSMQKLGFTLKEISIILEVKNNDADFITQKRVIITEKIKELKLKKEALNSSILMLVEKLKNLEK